MSTTARATRTAPQRRLPGSLPRPASPGGESPGPQGSSEGGPVRGRGARRNRRERAAGARERGVASLEYLGMVPFLILVALAGIQLGIAAYCAQQAGTAARTAARTAAAHAPHPDPVQAGRQAVSGWVDPDITLTADTASDATAQATVHVPSVLPGVHLFHPVTRSATMPKEDDTP